MLSKKAAGGQKHGGFFSNFFGRKTKKDEPEQEDSKDKESNWPFFFLPVLLSSVAPVDMTWRSSVHICETGGSECILEELPIFGF